MSWFRSFGSILKSGASAGLRGTMRAAKFASPHLQRGFSSLRSSGLF